MNADRSILGRDIEGLTSTCYLRVVLVGQQFTEDGRPPALMASHLIRVAGCDRADVVDITDRMHNRPLCIWAYLIWVF